MRERTRDLKKPPPPVVIKIDGKKYKSNPIKKDLFDRILKLQEKGEGGDIDAAYEQVRIIFDIPKEVVYGLDVRHIAAITKVFTEKFLMGAGK